MDTYKCNERIIILLISLPGAGKSHLCENQLKPLAEKQELRTVRLLDCSTDIFVHQAMSSVLQEKFPDEGKPSLLIADDYHMLSKAHKTDLLMLDWLKVVLIGNRSDGTCSFL